MASSSDVLYDFIQPAAPATTTVQKDTIADRAAKDAEVVVKIPPTTEKKAPKKSSSEKEKKPAATKPKAKKAVDTDVTKKEKKAAKRPLTGAAAASSAKKKKQSETAGGETKQSTSSSERRPSGYTTAKAERDRILRALSALKKRVAHKIEKDKQKGKKSTTSVCSILNNALIKFYTTLLGQFEEEFKEYLEGGDDLATKTTSEDESMNEEEEEEESTDS